MGVLFERCRDVHLEGIGIRGGSFWQTLFLVTEDASAVDLSLLGTSVNTDGIDIDGVRRFVARDCFIRCEDDGFGWHALDAEANGEPVTEDCLAEDCVIWNTGWGNGLRIGASMETGIFQNITFRDIDVLEHAGAAIYSDHSDWAVCKNIRFENFVDETSKKTVEMFIDRTRYSNATGYRDGRGAYDGLEFVNLTSPAGDIELRGYDEDHAIENVVFRDTRRGGEPVDELSDIEVNAYVSGVEFQTTPEDADIVVGAFQIPLPGSGWISLEFSSVYGRAYAVEGAAGPDAPEGFADLGTFTGRGLSTRVSFRDPQASDGTIRVYRVRQVE